MDFEDFLHELPRVRTENLVQPGEDSYICKAYAFIPSDYRIYRIMVFALQSHWAYLREEYIAKAYIHEKYLTDDKQYEISLVIEFINHQSAIDAEGSMFSKKQ